MKKKIAVANLVFAAVIGYFFISPLIAVSQLKKAIVAKDQEQLSECIDFPTVRQNLRDQLNVVLAKEAERQRNEKPNDTVATGIAVFVGGLFVDKILDFYLTPSGLTEVLSGREIQLGESAKRDRGNAISQDLLPDAKYSFESHRKFSVRIPHEKGGHVRFVFTRNELTWRLTNIVLPTSRK